ncbi:protein GUCD1-like isoform X1 [Asterias amurensis]|uniref:protein GUCD1-like isoform X1 n=1 Tax=Asterias amurensis TaxID=7602 RepID=UPI003AB4DD8B
MIVRNLNLISFVFITDASADSVFVNVPHIIQSEDWDCGLACVKMILSYINPAFKDKQEDFNVICDKLNFSKSVWTIDLANILVEFNVKHQLYTITLEVDPSYEDLGFYHEFIAEDFVTEQHRINKLFKSASSLGIKADKGQVTHEEIVNHLSNQNPAVVLIDDTVLHCQECSARSVEELGCGLECLTLFNKDKEQGYIGHFIVLCGYDKMKQHFLYRNPGIESELCACTFSNLEEARRSRGTDEDILFVYQS